METRLLLGCLSLALSFAAATLLASGLLASAPHRRDAASVAHGSDAPRAGRLAWRVRNGFAPAIPLADALLGSARVRRFADEAVRLLKERRFATTERALLSCVVVASTALWLAALVATRSVAGALAVVTCALAAVGWRVRSSCDRRRDGVRDAVPDVLRSMGTCFEAGLSLQQTLSQVADESSEPLRTVFAHAAHVLETGGSAARALEDVRRASGASELAFVAVALDVQHQTGGSMKQVLDAARESVEGELALKRSLKVQTAQARLSAQVVSVMPFALVAVFSLVSEDFLAPFFASPAGYALLALALGMQAAGVGIVRRVLAAGAAS
ncbi:type II secretion system protein [Gordonibacter sp. 28C]|uniref:type II secretion system F family protein n=1 Tax=Gordonibacter sp. 28C TaxID=2078569 RepID=UPI000DF7FBB2|nr:type II secretion system F family protein [Gordonibacter sp. 28C]RDB62029.1 type II secretion system protein [Gordonibacter sp. 28C]